MGTSPPANDGEGGNYLMMTASPTPKSADSCASPRFDFSSAHLAHLNELNITTMSNNKVLMGESVELRPMLPVATVPNGFSNPNYQNPPAINCATDLDDPPRYRDAIKNSSPPPPSPQHYVNFTAANASPRHLGGDEEEFHYVNPKNNSRVSP